MTVAAKIKNAPDLTKLGAAHSTFTHPTEKSTTTTYNTLAVVDKSTPVVIPNLPAQPPAVALSFVRNNRVFGYYSDAEQARLAIQYLIQRELEFGTDV